MRNIPKRITELQNLAAQTREKQEAIVEEFCKLHGYKLGSDPGDELAAVIYDGANYQDCLKRIMNMKKG